MSSPASSPAIPPTTSSAPQRLPSRLQREERDFSFREILLGYVFGSAIAGTGVGWIADHWAGMAPSSRWWRAKPLAFNASQA